MGYGKYGYRKDFSQELHDVNDPPSRKLIISYFAKQTPPVTITENPNKFKVDLLAPDGHRIEAERRPPWIETVWPYRDVNIPSRKSYLSEGTIDYIIVSADFKRIGIILAESLKRHIVDTNLHANPNKYSKGKIEYFYKVPLSDVKWITV